jgi:two-component system alkaline phosphatase synthesis response regulator PhoP
MDKSRLLVVEDERNVGSTLVERLRQEGYEVAWAQSAEEAWLEIEGRRFELALLDVGLPDGSGFDVAARLRKTQPSTAVIFLTAFGAPEDRVRGLELGAEDYVTKPFHFKELVLRVQNALKRARYVAPAQARVTVGEAEVDFEKFEARVRGPVGVKTHSLTHKEVALLKLLVERAGKVVSRDEILDHVWAGESEDAMPTSRTIDNFVLRLRKLVEADPENPQIIRSVRGVGYQLHPKDSE